MEIFVFPTLTLPTANFPSKAEPVRHLEFLSHPRAFAWAVIDPAAERKFGLMERASMLKSQI